MPQFHSRSSETATSETATDIAKERLLWSATWKEDSGNSTLKVKNAYSKVAMKP